MNLKIMILSIIIVIPFAFLSIPKEAETLYPINEVAYESPHNAMTWCIVNDEIQFYTLSESDCNVQKDMWELTLTPEEKTTEAYGFPTLNFDNIWYEDDVFGNCNEVNTGDWCPTTWEYDNNGCATYDGYLLVSIPNEYSTVYGGNYNRGSKLIINGYPSMVIDFKADDESTRENYGWGVYGKTSCYDNFVSN